MYARLVPSERRSVLEPLKALLGRRVVDGGDSGWWRALIPALAIIAVLFAALQVRSSIQDADRALVRADAAREMATSVDRLAVVGSAERRESRPRAQGRQGERAGTLRGGDPRRHRQRPGRRRRRPGRPGRPGPRQDALRAGATRADRRRADAALSGLQPAARSLSDRADAAASVPTTARRATHVDADRRPAAGDPAPGQILVAPQRRRRRAPRAPLPRAAAQLVRSGRGGRPRDAEHPLRHPGDRAHARPSARGSPGHPPGPADPPRRPRHPHRSVAGRARQRRRPRDRPLARPAPRGRRGATWRPAG